MKTATSSTKSALGKILVGLALTKVDTWAKNELKNLQHYPGMPLCIPISDKAFTVGYTTIIEQGPTCWELIQNDKLIHSFYSKKAAIFYGIFTKLGMFVEGDLLLAEDRLVAKYNDSYHFYQKKLAIKKLDNFKYQLYESRYLDYKSRYELAREELEKRLNSAKYMTVWNRLL